MISVQIPYRHQMGGHCGSGALRDLIEWAGLGWAGPPTEGLVFALGGALHFSYIRSKKLRPPLYLVGRGSDLEQDLFDRLNAPYSMRSTEDPDLGWKWVKEQLDDGVPVMVWADIGELPYLRAKLGMSRHDIVITGYDDDTQVAFVVDNDRDATQVVPYENLRRARASTGFPTPTRHTTYIVDWPSMVPDLATIAGPALTQSADALTGATHTAHIVAIPNAAVAGQGLDGVTTFAADLARWSELFDNDTLESALFALGALIEKAGTGGGLFRNLQADGCRRIAEILHCDAASEAAHAARTASCMWTRVAKAAFDPASSLRRRAAAAAAAAAQLPDAEARLAEALRTAGSQLSRSAPS
ncbi:BtrH N-terminal domain-containing protein [Mycobacterium sp. IDR2000157661]|uniref:BtrH N-terminal domain-containing protein n=1 Tax=Mycobacterium sp. IDR2000157661 TaxID=2867005 RepID=UPI001EEBD8A8|nr:BtrH N-terminal domain-containing protein [Mycobacterium sp. IDR2000157661]ULE32154.1 BtrH N-terminal domain-containing protein [Mycobacterium sp. IDR2000157661]